MRRMTTVISAILLSMLVGIPAATACGFLVSENGSIKLGRTSTFVAWEDGVERYITNFTFEGPTESFGSIIPLPSEPTDVARAGDWTLQRLEREVNPPPEFAFDGAVAFAARSVEVILVTKIDSLDVVVLKGGGADVLAWVNENGFNLPPGAGTAHLLEFYSSRSPYFMAARFDTEAAEQDEFVAGDGIPVMITMPTIRPWVPLHILHGASPDSTVIDASVFLLTPERPNLLYGEGLTVEGSEWANDSLLDDLRSDENMDWIPETAWFTYLDLNTDASNLTYDLSVGVGDIAPSFVDAGFTRFEPTTTQLEAFGLEPVDPNRGWKLIGGAAAVAIVAGAFGGLVVRRRRSALMNVHAEPFPPRVEVGV